MHKDIYFEFPRRIAIPQMGVNDGKDKLQVQVLVNNTTIYILKDV